MVEYDVLHILHTKRRHALVGQVTGTETDMTDNDVRAQLYPVACQANATGRSRLSGNSGVRFDVNISGQINSTSHFEQHGTGCIVSCVHSPTEGSLLVRIIQTGDIVHFRATAVNHTTSRCKTTIALAAREGNEVILIVGQLRENSIDSTVFIDGKAIGSTGGQRRTATILPAVELMALGCCSRQGHRRTRIDEMCVTADGTLGADTNRSHTLAAGLDAARQCAGS